MPRRGRDLERLVAQIERSTHDAEGVTVHSPAMLADRDTGRSREHDVMIEILRSHLRIRVAIECRDRTAKVGSPEVEGFWAKCQRTGINQGVIVSASGFSDGALKKAATYNIRCLSLADAEGFDWCQCAGIWFVQPEIIESRVDCIAAEPIAFPYKVYAADGSEFTSKHAGQIATKELSKVIPVGMAGGPHKQLIKFGAQPGHVIGADGKRQDILGMDFWLVYRMNERFLPFQYHRYVDDQSGAELSASAVAQFEIGDLSAQLLLLKQGDGGIKVTVSHAPKSIGTKK